MLQRVQVVNGIAVQPGSLSNVDEADVDLPEEWFFGWDCDCTDDWYGDWWWTAPEEQSSEWHEDENFLFGGWNHWFKSETAVH